MLFCSYFRSGRGAVERLLVGGRGEGVEPNGNGLEPKCQNRANSDSTMTIAPAPTPVLLLVALLQAIGRMTF